MTEDLEETLLEFPCKFPVKAMGRAEEGFEETVSGIVLAHAAMYPGEKAVARPSGEGNFVSVTLNIEATSKAQLDAIYQDLTDCDKVLMAL